MEDVRITITDQATPVLLSTQIELLKVENTALRARVAALESWQMKTVYCTGNIKQLSLGCHKHWTLAQAVRMVIDRSRKHGFAVAFRYY